jgi:hypothetical protein
VITTPISSCDNWLGIVFTLDGHLKFKYILFGINFWCWGKKCVLNSQFVCSAMKCFQMRQVEVTIFSYLYPVIFRQNRAILVPCVYSKLLWVWLDVWHLSYVIFIFFFANLRKSVPFWKTIKIWKRKRENYLLKIASIVKMKFKLI